LKTGAQQRAGILGAVPERHPEGIRGHMADEYELPLRVFGKLTKGFLSCLCIGYAKSGQRGERE
jgi:hypothetical protein